MVDKRIDAAIFNQFPIAIEGVAGHAHDLAGPGYVAEFLSQIQQTCFVFNDGIVSMQYESYLFCFD